MSRTTEAARPDPAWASAGTAFNRRLTSLAHVPDANAWIPQLAPWVYEAGNPYFDWFFSGSETARRVVEAMMRKHSSEFAVRWVTALFEGGRPIGGFVALPCGELAASRAADALTALAEVEPAARPGLVARLREARRLFLPVEPDCFYVSRLGVVPEHRGHGLGRALFGASLVKGRTEGFGRVRIDVSTRNVRGIRHYQSFGFRPIDRSTVGGIGYLAMILEY
jgi:GNAT superfamily N-acetyltransferase